MLLLFVAGQGQRLVRPIDAGIARLLNGRAMRSILDDLTMGGKLGKGVVIVVLRWNTIAREELQHFCSLTGPSVEEVCVICRYVH